MPGHVRFTQNLETASSPPSVPPQTVSFMSSVRVCLVTAVLFLGALSTSATSRPSPPAAYKYRMVMCQKRKKYFRGNVFINTSKHAYNLERESACVPFSTSVLQSALHSSAITEQCCRPVEVAQHQQVPMPGHVRFTQDPETTSSLLLVPPPTLLFRSSVRVCSVAAVLFLGVVSTLPTSRPSSPAAYKYRMVMCQKKTKVFAWQCVHQHVRACIQFRTRN
jgi:ketosteroid isomerase-like protein